jgi:hypothetical protein
LNAHFRIISDLDWNRGDLIAFGRPFLDPNQREPSSVIDIMTTRNPLRQANEALADLHAGRPSTRKEKVHVQADHEGTSRHPERTGCASRATQGAAGKRTPCS